MTPTGGASLWRRLALPLAAAAGALAATAPILFFPLGRDAGVFAYDTCEMLAGRTPYLDFFDQKPPGILVLYAIPIGLAGRSTLAIHLFEWLWAGLTAAAVATAGRRLGRPAGGAAAGLASALLFSPAVSDFWHRGQVETFVGLLYCALLLLLVPSSGRLRAGRLFLAGFITGACACMKPNMVASPVLLAAAVLLAGPGGDRLQRTLRAAAPFAAGAVLLPGLLIGWLALRGALGTAVETSLAVNASYLDSSAGEILGLLVSQNGLALGIAAALAVILLLVRAAGPSWLSGRMPAALGEPGRRGLHAAILAALWAGGLATLVAGRFLFPYHHQVLVLPAALSLGAAAAALGGPLWDRFERRPLAAAGVFVLGALCVLGIVERTLRPQDRAFLRGDLRLADYQASPRFDFWDYSFRDERALAAALAEATAPADRIQVFGHGSLALFLAGRRSATRFSWTNAAMDPRYGREGLDRQEILGALTATPPAAIVVTMHDPLHRFGTTTSDRQVAAFPPLARFLEEHYALAQTLGDFRLMLPKTAGGVSGPSRPADASPGTTPAPPGGPPSE